MIQEKKKYLLYGQLITNFASAKTSEAAIFGLFESIEKVFDFPYKFAPQAKKLFLPYAT
jgi:hypothetical protein